MSLIDSLSKTMTTAQVYHYFNGREDLLVQHMESCSIGNKRALVDLLSHKYKESSLIERPDIPDEDIVNHLRGDS